MSVACWVCFTCTKDYMRGQQARVYCRASKLDA